MDKLFKIMSDKKASDLHIKAGNIPFLRIDGKLAPIEGEKKLTSEQVAKMAISMMGENQIKDFERLKEVDFAIQGEKTDRFRVNIFQEKGNTGLVIRRVSLEHPSLVELNLPEVLKNLSDFQRGLVLVTGTAGSGKTTALSAMIHHINTTRSANIINNINF